jgi:hypothetical protein
MYHSGRRGERPLLLGVLFFIAAAGASCQLRTTDDSTPDATKFDYRDFYSDTQRLVLCFDLRDDVRPLSGLVIRSNQSQVPEGHIVVLPFGSKSAVPNETLLTSSGNYRDFTLIHYIVSERSGGTVGIGIVPIFDLSPPALYSLEDLTGSLYLVRSGLERRFVYRYPTQGSGRASGSIVPNIPTDTLDAVAVAIPEMAVRKEIRDGRTEIPNRLYNNKVAAFYPANSAEATLQLRYEVPASLGQKLLLEYGVKAVAAILTPLLGLLFLDPNKARRTKRIVLWGGAIVEIAVLVLVWRVALVMKGESEIKTTYDLVVVAVGALATVIVLWIKARAEQKPAPSPPPGGTGVGSGP